MGFFVLLRFTMLLLFLFVFWIDGFLFLQFLKLKIDQF